MPIKNISCIALLLAVTFTAGCHKSTSDADKPSAATPATAQPATPDQAQSAAAASGGAPATAPSTAQPAPTSSTAAAPTGAVTPTPDQPVANAPEAAPVLPEVPAGTVLSIRMSQTISVKHAAAGTALFGDDRESD